MKILSLLTALIIATTIFAQVPNYVPTNGLVGWWPFSGNANDESGNGNNGTVNGAILTIDRNGVANTAYSFDGTTYIEVPNWSSLQGSTDFTISIWAKPSIYNGWILAFGLNQDGQGFECGNWHWGGNNFGTQIWKYNYVTPSQTVLTSMNWNFITIKFHQNTLYTYLNGILQNSQLVNYIQTNLSVGTLNFGKQIGFDEFYTGILDEIGIWNRALTECEIKDLYYSQLGSTNSTSSQTQTALDAYTWPVNNQTYTQSGTYSDTLVNAAGCDSIVTLNLTLNYTGINENNSSSLVISPNPTTGSFSLHGLEQLGTITSLRIIDNNGKVVQVLDPKATQFACSSLKTGVYFLEVNSSKSNEIIKLIKE
jgi:hypothetical protein